jgi:hypothetical protein
MKKQSHGNVMIPIPFQHSLLPYANAKTDLPRIHAVMVAVAGYLQFGPLKILSKNGRKSITLLATIPLSYPMTIS